MPSMTAVVGWLRLGLLLALALAAAVFYGRWQTEQTAHAQTKTDMATAALQAAADAADTTQKLQEDKDHALQQSARRAQAYRADALNAGAELDRLRVALATGATGSCAHTGTTADDRADPVRELFGQCASALASLAQTADRLNDDRLTCFEAWPRPEPVD